jgi:hypothetical protein
LFWFVDYWGSWVIRGARFIFGLSAGVFDFDHNYGLSDSVISFRVILLW